MVTIQEDLHIDMYIIYIYISNIIKHLGSASDTQVNGCIFHYDYVFCTFTYMQIKVCVHNLGHFGGLPSLNHHLG